MNSDGSFFFETDTHMMCSELTVAYPWTHSRIFIESIVFLYYLSLDVLYNLDHRYQVNSMDTVGSAEKC